MLAALGASALLAAAPAGEIAERLAPVLVHDRREASPLASAGHASVPVPGRPPRRGPTAYARVTDGHVQYWLFYADNPQDRGIVRTGRHEGDWELVEVAVDRAGRPRAVLASQHSGAEACRWDAVRREGTHPVVYVANGSHAGYFRPGRRDRTWPDPDDEAGGDGRRVRPRVALVTGDAPRWIRWPGRWGRTRAGWVPGEMDSPRGPAFQRERWSGAWRSEARRCGAAAAIPNRREDAITLGVLALALGAALVALRRRFAAGRPRGRPPAGC